MGRWHDEDAKAKLFHEYISEPFPGDVDAKFLNMCFKSRQIPYKDGDKLYIRVPEIIDRALEFDITEQCRRLKTYQAITYKIGGTANYVGVFHEKVRKFYSIQNYDDFKLHVETTEMVEAMRRKRH